jgi:hypothetical protein
LFDNADLIHHYTRADAIADGTLIDVSAAAREAGGRTPGTGWVRGGGGGCAGP